MEVFFLDDFPLAKFCTWLKEADLIFGCIRTQNETTLPDMPKADTINVMTPFTHHFKLK